jgi:hypothetical protein
MRAISSDELTSRISGAPEHNGPILVPLRTQDIVELNGKAVQVTNVQRAKVMVKGVVEEGIIDGKVAWRRAVRFGERGRSSLTSFPGRDGSLRVREEVVVGGRIQVRGEVQAIWEIV